jgi:hypothetical protein
MPNFARAGIAAERMRFGSALEGARDDGWECRPRALSARSAALPRGGRSAVTLIPDEDEYHEEYWRRRTRRALTSVVRSGFGKPS